MTVDVAVLVAEPVPAFELGITSEIFGLPPVDPDLPRYTYAVCAATPGPLRTSAGFQVTPTDGLDRLDRADLIIVTGAAPPVPPPPAELLEALRRAADRGATIAALCTGAFTLAATGLLDGRTATTHWAHADELATRFPRVTVDMDKIYLVDGAIATSAGASAAIDLCLHLIRREHGADVANRVARAMVVPAHRSGGQAQFSRRPVVPQHAGNGLSELLDWAGDHLDEDLTVEGLALRASMSTRTFIRHFAEATGSTPAAWVREQRVRHAERLLERDGATVASVARRSGFGSVDTFRRQFRRVRGIGPETYRAAFRTAG